MNYVSVLMVAVALFATIYWYASGRFYYIGPRVRAQLVNGVDAPEGEKISPGTSSDGNRPGELKGSEAAQEIST